MAGSANIANRELCAMSTRAQLASKGLTDEDCKACGIVYFHEGRTQIMIGRKERSRDVIWAGNPDKPKLRIGGILCPRNSFDKFMEKAHKESRAWSTQDLHVITVFRDRICEHAHNWMMRLLQNDIEDTNRKYLNAIDR
jgi:light-regulated signal transduction histidine kinase (bacteriophytochrome)